MADKEDVRRLVMALPGVVENAEDFSFRVNGKLVAWSFPDRSTRPIVRRPDVLAVRTENLWEKDALLNLDPETFFTTDHYNGYPAILVRLANIELDELRGLLVAAWRTRAPKRVVREFDAAK